MKILVADAYPVVRAGLKHNLKHLGDVTFVEAGSEHEAITTLAAEPNIDLVISDLVLGADGIDRFRILRALRNANRNVPIIVFSVLESRDVVLKSIDLGAMGYIPKSLSEDDIQAVIRRVLDGETWVPTKLLQQPEPARRDDTQPPLSHPESISDLTDRQKEVFDLLAQGRSNRQIAASLGVSEHTIRVHMSAILKTLGLKNRTQAAILASQINQPA